MNKNLDTKLLKDIEDFASAFPQVKFKKGELLYRPGDTFSNIYIFKSGFVRIYLIAKNGKEVTYDIFNKSLSIILLLFSQAGLENQYYFEAINPVEAWRVPKEKLINFLEGRPEIFKNLIPLAFVCCQKFFSKTEYLIAGDSKSKVSSVLYYFASQYGKKKGEEYSIEFPLPHRLIASLTGLTRETVTIQILKLEKMGIIRTEGRRLIIKRMEDLKEESVFDSEE